MVIWVGLDTVAPQRRSWAGNPSRHGTTTHLHPSPYKWLDECADAGTFGGREWADCVTVPVCIGPPLGVALRRGPESYETAALPLSYVGAGGV